MMSNTSIKPLPAEFLRGYLLPNENPSPKLIKHLKQETEGFLYLKDSGIDRRQKDRRRTVDGLSYRRIGWGSTAVVYKIGQKSQSTAVKIYYKGLENTALTEIMNYSAIVHGKADKDSVPIYSAHGKSGWLHRGYASDNRKKQADKILSLSSDPSKACFNDAGFHLADVPKAKPGQFLYNRAQGLAIYDFDGPLLRHGKPVELPANPPALIELR